MCQPDIVKAQIGIVRNSMIEYLTSVDSVHFPSYQDAKYTHDEIGNFVGNIDPNTRNYPIFCSKANAKLTKNIYQFVPI